MLLIKNRRPYKTSAQNSITEPANDYITMQARKPSVSKNIKSAKSINSNSHGSEYSTPVEEKRKRILLSSFCVSFI